MKELRPFSLEKKIELELEYDLLLPSLRRAAPKELHREGWAERLGKLPPDASQPGLETGPGFSLA